MPTLKTSLKQEASQKKDLPFYSMIDIVAIEWKLEGNAKNIFFEKHHTYTNENKKNMMNNFCSTLSLRKRN